MAQWRELTEADENYRKQGLALLRQMLAGADVIEAPKLQALYDWCLQQEWDATPDKLEEYGPVLALAVGFGEEISKHTGMR